MKTYNCLFCGKESKVSLHQKANKYCSNTCQLSYQSKEKLDEWLKTGTVDTKSTPVWIKRYILEKQEGKCFTCGILDWNNKPIVFELEHRDGDSSNNTEDNLCCLCPNCHSQTSTYKAKNRGNGRHARRTRYKEGKSF